MNMARRPLALWERVRERALTALLFVSLASTAAISAEPQPILRTHSDTVELRSRWQSRPHVIAERLPTVLSAIVSEEREAIVAAKADGTVEMWGLENDESYLMVDAPHEFACAALAPTGWLLLASSDFNNLVKLFDIPSGRTWVEYQAESRPVALVFSADSTTLALATEDGDVLVWNTADGKLLYKLSIDANPVQIVALSGGGRQLAAAGPNGAVTVFTAAGEQQQRVATGRSRVTALAFSSDGGTLAVGKADGTTQLQLQSKSGIRI